MSARAISCNKIPCGVAFLVALANAQSADDVFNKFVTATSGWKTLSFAMGVTTRLSGRTMSMQSRTVLDRSGNTLQEMLSGPVRVATVVRGDTIQTKDLQSGKIETKVIPGSGQNSLQQMDPGARLFAIRKSNRFRIESHTADQIVVRGDPIQDGSGRTAARIVFATATGLPRMCEMLDSTGRSSSRMDFAWERHGVVEVMKSMKLSTTPSGKNPGMDLELQITGIHIDESLDPRIFQLKEGL